MSVQSTPEEQVFGWHRCSFGSPLIEMPKCFAVNGCRVFANPWTLNKGTPIAAPHRSLFSVVAGAFVQIRFGRLVIDLRCGLERDEQRTKQPFL